MIRFARDDPAEQERLKENVNKLVELTKCSENEAQIALHDADNDVTEAINKIYDGSSAKGQWLEQGRGKKPKKVAMVATTGVRSGSYENNDAEQSQVNNNNNRGIAVDGHPSSRSSRGAHPRGQQQGPPRFSRNSSGGGPGGFATRGVGDRDATDFGQRRGRGRGGGGLNRGGRGGSHISSNKAGKSDLFSSNTWDNSMAADVAAAPRAPENVWDNSMADGVADQRGVNPAAKIQAPSMTQDDGDASDWVPTSGTAPASRQQRQPQQKQKKTTNDENCWTDDDGQTWQEGGLKSLVFESTAHRGTPLKPQQQPSPSTLIASGSIYESTGVSQSPIDNASSRFSSTQSSNYTKTLAADSTASTGEATAVVHQKQPRINGMVTSSSGGGVQDPVTTWMATQHLKSELGIGQVKGHRQNPSTASSSSVLLHGGGGAGQDIETVEFMADLDGTAPGGNTGIQFGWAPEPAVGIHANDHVYGRSTNANQSTTAAAADSTTPFLFAQQQQPQQNSARLQSKTLGDAQATQNGYQQQTGAAVSSSSSAKVSSTATPSTAHQSTTSAVSQALPTMAAPPPLPPTTYFAQQQQLTSMPPPTYFTAASTLPPANFGYGAYDGVDVTQPQMQNGVPSSNLSALAASFAPVTAYGSGGGTGRTINVSAGFEWLLPFTSAGSLSATSRNQSQQQLQQQAQQYQTNTGGGGFPGAAQLPYQFVNYNPMMGTLAPNTYHSPVRPEDAQFGAAAYQFPFQNVPFDPFSFNSFAAALPPAMQPLPSTGAPPPPPTRNDSTSSYLSNSDGTRVRSDQGGVGGQSTTGGGGANANQLVGPPPGFSAPPNAQNALAAAMAYMPANYHPTAMPFHLLGVPPAMAAAAAAAVAAGGQAGPGGVQQMAMGKGGGGAAALSQQLFQNAGYEDPGSQADFTKGGYQFGGAPQTTGTKGTILGNGTLAGYGMAQLDGNKPYNQGKVDSSKFATGATNTPPPTFAPAQPFQVPQFGYPQIAMLPQMNQPQPLSPAITAAHQLQPSHHAVSGQTVVGSGGGGGQGGGNKMSGGGSKQQQYGGGGGAGAGNNGATGYNWNNN